MPELPEVETVARDLRPTDHRRHDRRRDDALGADPARDAPPEAFADGVAGRRIEGVGRRAKQIVIDLSGGASLTIHLKMTGQLFVVPQGGPEDPYVRLVLEPRGRPRDPVPRHPQVRQGRAVRPDPVTASSSPSRRTPSSRRSGRSRSTDAFTVAPSGAGIRSPEGPAEAAPARPVVRGRRRQHLRRRGALGGPAPSAPDGADAAARRRAAAVDRDPARSWPRRSSRRGSSIDDYTAPDGDGDDAGAPRRSTSGPASRASAAGGRSGGSSSAAGRRISAPGASACRPPTGPAPGRSCGR